MYTHKYVCPWGAIQLRVRVIRWPAFWRSSMNEANTSPISPLPRHVSSRRLGKRASRSPPSSDHRQRKRSTTNPSLSRGVFTLLNDLRSSRHLDQSSSLSFSDDRPCTLCSRVTSSTSEDSWPNTLTKNLPQKIARRDAGSRYLGKSHASPTQPPRGDKPPCKLTS